MFVKLHERVHLNLSRITRTKIDHVEDGIRVRFYEGQTQIAKSKRFEKVKDAEKWLVKLFKSAGLF
ncbi:sodium-dependent tyrosine transporter [Arcobacter sp. HD9-500m-PIT-SAG02]|nr:sodium-dependent tyrosine transporter [Arcobacter sp. HD9-500m-PIT-SAG02]